MIRTLRTFVWLRWRLAWNGVRGAQRRDAMEQASRALAITVPLIFFALSLGSILGIGLMAFFGGQAAADGRTEPILVVFIIRVLLALALILIVVSAMAAPVQSSLSHYTRLLLLPIRRQTLHLVEVAANLADPWLGIFVIGLLVLPIGIAMGGRIDAAGWAAAGGAAMLAALALTGSIASFFVSWLVRSRRRSEMVTLVFVLGLSLLWLLPFLLANRSGRRRVDPATGRTHTVLFTIEEFDRNLPAWAHALPSELYSRALASAFSHDQSTAAATVGWLWLEVAGLFVVSSLGHRQLLGSLESQQGIGSRARSRGTMRRLPWTSSTVSAVAMAQLHTALRTVRGRFVVLLPGPMIGLMTILFRRLPANREWVDLIGARGEWILAASLAFSLLALQPFTMNQLASDRSGLTLQFLSPISDEDLARGKTLGLVLVYTMAAALCLLLATLLSPRTAPTADLAVIAGAYAALLWLAPVGVCLSALFPVAADLSKTGTGGNPHPFAQLLGILLVVLLAAPPVAIELFAATWWRRPALALPLMLIWLGVSLGASLPLLRLTARVITPRRENLALVAQGR